MGKHKVTGTKPENKEMAEEVRMEFITSKVYKKILTPELFREIERVNIKDGVFEEIPLFSRYKDIDFLKKYIPPEKVLEYLLHVSLFLLYDVSLYFEYIAKVSSSIFIGITLVNPEEEMDDVGFCIPNILISTKKTCKFLQHGTRFNVDKNDVLNKQWGMVGMSNMYKCYKTTTITGGEKIERIYIIPRKRLHQR